MITDTEARRIADQWHGGGGTALYAFASTGAIDTARSGHFIYREITETIDTERRSQQGIATDDLRSLIEYIDYHGPRGPVPGWNNLTW